MRDFRLKAYEHYESRPTPKWGGNLDQIDFEDIHYFVRASEKVGHTWDDVPEDIKNTFDKLGIPEAERKFLAGVGAQYESRVRLPPGERAARGSGRDLHRHGHRPHASTRTSSASTGRPSSRQTTTSSPR